MAPCVTAGGGGGMLGGVDLGCVLTSAGESGMVAAPGAAGSAGTGRVVSGTWVSMAQRGPRAFLGRLRAPERGGSAGHGTSCTVRGGGTAHGHAVHPTAERHPALRANGVRWRAQGAALEVARSPAAPVWHGVSLQPCPFQPCPHAGEARRHHGCSALPTGRRVSTKLNKHPRNRRVWACDFFPFLPPPLQAINFSCCVRGPNTVTRTREQETAPKCGTSQRWSPETPKAMLGGTVPTVPRQDAASPSAHPNLRPQCPPNDSIPLSATCPSVPPRGHQPLLTLSPQTWQCFPGTTQPPLEFFSPYFIILFSWFFFLLFFFFLWGNLSQPLGAVSVFLHLVSIRLSAAQMNK